MTTAASAPFRDQDWHEAWSHRPELMRVARSRTPSEQDAEDVVAEALLRAVSRKVEPDVLGPWLTRVVVNLCIDLARDRAKHPQRVAYSVRQQTGQAPAEEIICDRAEAQWLHAQSVALPPRQRQALILRADGLDLEEVAAELGASYKTAESLLSRGRASLRARLRSTHGIAVVALLPWRWVKSALPTAGAGAAAAAAGAVFTAAMLSPHSQPGAPPTRPQPATTVVQTSSGPTSVSEASTGPASTPPSRPAERLEAGTAPRPATPPVRDRAVAPRPLKGQAVVDVRQDVGGKDATVTGTKHDADETFQESLNDCLEHHAADPLTLVNGTCPPDQ